MTDNTKVSLGLKVQQPTQLKPLLAFKVDPIDTGYLVTWKLTEAGQDAVALKQAREIEFHRMVVPLVIVFTFKADKIGRISGLRIYADLCVEGMRAVRFQQRGNNTIHVMLGWVSDYSDVAVIEKAKKLIGKINDCGLAHQEQASWFAVEPFRLFVWSRAKFSGLGMADVFTVRDFFNEQNEPKGSGINERYDRQDMEVTTAIDEPWSFKQWLVHMLKRLKSHRL